MKILSAKKKSFLSTSSNIYRLFVEPALVRTFKLGIFPKGEIS